MQIVAGCVHIPGLTSYVQCGKESSEPCSMHWLNPGFGARFREELQSLVAVAPNHPYSVYARYTHCNWKLCSANRPADKQPGDPGRSGCEEAPSRRVVEWLV